MLNQLIGKPLKSVQYANFTSGSHPTSWDDRLPGVDPVDLAVAIRFGSRWLRVDWATDGITAGLAVMVLDEVDFGSWSTMDASDSSVWRACLGQNLIGYSLAWFVAETEALESLLCLRLEFDQPRIAIALSALRESGLRSLPDEICLIADVRSADAAVPAAGGYWA